MKKHKKVIATITAIVIIILEFAVVFCLYDSPAYYVKTPEGEIYLDNNSEPIIYYKDLFGREFYNKDGKRIYAAVPVSIGRITDPEALSELQSQFNEDINGN